jgi:hypothetical protein
MYRQLGVLAGLGVFVCALVVGVGPAWAAGGGPGGSGASEPVPDLGPSNLLILVNASSPASESIAGLYRAFHPEIAPAQVLHLTGLPDCASASAGPVDEIITRDEFEALIAQPVRDYLITKGWVDSVYCIVTTAGLPYRIEDTDPDLADVVKPAASAAMLTVDNRYRVNAASVEAELAVLFQIDPALPYSAEMPIKNRVVNPYQGYASEIRAWEGCRDVLNRRESFRWTYMWRVYRSPKIEGTFDYAGYSAYNRAMSPADIYLVTRLDGPRAQGEYPVLAVLSMLERAAAVSDPTYEDFVGYDPNKSFVAIDESPCAPAQFAYCQVYNFPPQYDFLTLPDHPVPPGAEDFDGVFNEGNHFELAFETLAGFEPPPLSTLIGFADFGLGSRVLWNDTCVPLSDYFLPPNAGLIGLLTYGRNGGEGRSPTYLLTDGPDGGPLFTCAYGAVFSSLESFNAVTMFTDASTSQGKLVEFLEMGGSGAVGHAFEPGVEGLIQGDFLLVNLLRDDDEDGVGDMTLAEAAFTAMPFLSWAEVVLGDPLMRLRVASGGLVDPEWDEVPLPGSGRETSE